MKKSSSKQEKPSASPKQSQDKIVISNDSSYVVHPTGPAIISNGIINDTITTNSSTFFSNTEWINDVLKINTWMNDVIYTTAYPIIKIENQEINFPIYFDPGTTNTEFHIQNVNFYNNVQINIDPGNFDGLVYTSWKRNTKKKRWHSSIEEELGHYPRALNRGADFGNSKENELVALGLLKSMIDGENWKRYLKYGFVTVKGPSGFTYQIGRKSHLITVWHNGIRVASLCIYVLDSSIPPTDEIVTKMLMCMYDEPDTWKRANVSIMSSKPYIVDKIRDEVGFKAVLKGNSRLVVAA